MKKRIKLPECLQGWHNENRKPFRQEVYESTIYPTSIMFGENYIYCETYDAKVVKDVIKDFKKCIKLK